MRIMDPYQLGRRKHGADVVIGLDVGQVRDPSAIAVAECLRRNRKDLPDTLEWYFPVRFLERVPLNTPYPAVAERIVEIVESLQRREEPPRRIIVAIDCTGVGRGLSDILAQPLKVRGVKLSNVTLVAGLKQTGELGRGDVSLGKEQLVSRLAALFQTGRIEIPANNPEAAAMHRELLDFEIKATATGMQSGAFKTGSHDDLVVALALATLYNPKSKGLMTF